MLVFTASETIFMTSMALCFFFTWQTYAVDTDCFDSVSFQKDIIVGVHFSDVMVSVAAALIEKQKELSETKGCMRFSRVFEPFINGLEAVIGRGGTLNPQMTPGKPCA